MNEKLLKWLEKEIEWCRVGHDDEEIDYYDGREDALEDMKHYIVKLEKEKK